MSLTPAMKQMLRNMTQVQIETMFQTANQPRLTVDLPKNLSRGKGKKKLCRAAASVGKTTRPLNSWMAFRSYYSTAFHGYQQKEISGFLTSMWQSDPFKAKWSILAKAYSLIRDSQGKDDAPLDQFLAITGPLIGIIMPGHYLQVMGWEITTNGDGQTVMRRDDRFLNERLFLTNLSVNDLIRHCFDKGFFFGKLSEVLSLDNEAVMTMASSVQSTSASQTSVPNQIQVTYAAFANDVEADGLSTEGRPTSKDGITAQPISDSNPEHNATEETGGFTNLSEARDLSNASTVVDGASAMTVPALSYPSSPSVGSPYSGHAKLSSGALAAVAEAEEDMGHPRIISDDLNPASGLSAANFQLASQYPFNAEFDPNSPAFVFDPFLGNQFDVFEMSDIAWTELVDFDSCPLKWYTHCSTFDSTAFDLRLKIVFAGQDGSRCTLQ